MQLYRPNNPRQAPETSIGKASKEDKELVPFAIDSAVDGMNTKAKASSFNPKNG